MTRCEYCNNHAHRNAHNPHNNELEDLCEIHYSYIKPDALGKVNPVDVGRCIRCGCKALNKDGTKERLIDHHVNYPLDLTVPVCSTCHAQIHADEPDDRYLERTERENCPFTPVGTRWEEGLAIHEDFKNGRKMGRSCPECSTELIRPLREMGFDEGFLCPNAECPYTALTLPEVDGWKATKLRA